MAELARIVVYVAALLVAVDVAEIALILELLQQSDIACRE